MSKPLFCILGASASGKSTLVQKLEIELNMKQIASYTTRPPRYEGEAGHTFVTEEEFQSLSDIVAYNYYLDNHYGVTSQQIDDEAHDLYVVDQTGLNELKEKYKGDRKIYSVYIDCLPLNRYDRLFDRYFKMYQNSLVATNRAMERIKQDEIEFENCNLVVDYVITNNDNIETAYDELKNYIQAITKSQDNGNENN